MSNFKLVKIGERNGEYEYEWYTIALKYETDHETLTDFYGGLDNSDWAIEDNKSMQGKYWIDGERICWIEREYEISNTRRNTLRELGIT
jgi:hypothetical protein